MMCLSMHLERQPRQFYWPLKLSLRGINDVALAYVFAGRPCDTNASAHGGGTAQRFDPAGARWRAHATLSRNPVGDSHEELPNLVDPVGRALLEDVNRASAAEATLGPMEELAPALRIRIQVEQ